MNHKKKQFLKIYVWLFAGILLAAGIGLMKIGGTLDVNDPMNQGRVYDFSKKAVTSSSKTWSYDIQTGIYTVQSGTSGKAYSRIPTGDTWNYLNLSVGNLSTETSQWSLIYYNGKSQKIAEQTVTVANGDNMIPVAATEPFRKIRIKILEQEGLEFSILAMQLRTNPVGFSLSVFIDTFLVAWGIYFLISLIVYLGKRVKGASVLGILQYIYKLPGDYLGQRIAGKLSEGAIGNIQTVLFGILFLVAPVMNICNVYHNSDYYKYGILGCAVLLIMIALLSWEKPLEDLEWRGILSYGWFLLWIWICISDMLVGKEYAFTGYVFLFVVGFFYFMWNQMEKPKALMNRMVRGLEWTFPIVVVYSLICRKRYVGVLYNGAFADKDEMALYALAILIVFLAELQYVLCHTALAYRQIRIITYGIGISLAVYYLYRAHSLGAILTGGVAGIVLVLRLLREAKNFASDMRRTMCMLGVSVLCSVVVVLGMNQLNLYLPDWFGTNIVYQNEKKETALSVDEMAEIEKMAPGHFEDVNHIEDEEDALVWKNYLRKVNFFGNENGKLRVGDAWEFAPNGVIQMVYRYGMFVLIPYMLLLTACLYITWRRKGYLMFMITVAYCMVTVIYNLEQPFLHPLWILFYLGMGQLFFRKKKKSAE